MDDGCAEALPDALDSLVADGAVTAWTRGPYDAEVAQFGGPTGLALTHRWFTAESLAVLEHHRLRLNGTARIGSELFSLMLIDRLLRRLYDDWECWDVWCKLSLTGRLVDDAAGAVDPSRARAARVLLSNQARILGAASEPERTQFARYDRLLDDIVPDIIAAVDAGRLLWGPARDPPVLDRLPLESNAIRRRRAAVNGGPDGVRPVPEARPVISGRRRRPR